MISHWYTMSDLDFSSTSIGCAILSIFMSALSIQSCMRSFASESVPVCMLLCRVRCRSAVPITIDIPFPAEYLAFQSPSTCGVMYTQCRADGTPKLSSRWDNSNCESKDPSQEMPNSVARALGSKPADHANLRRTSNRSPTSFFGRTISGSKAPAVAGLASAVDVVEVVVAAPVEAGEAPAVENVTMVLPQ